MNRSQGEAAASWVIRRLGIVGLAVSAIALSAGASRAAQELHLTRGQYFTLHLQADASRVTIADPKVVTPKIISPRLIRLLAHKTGATNLLVDYEGGGMDSFQVIVSVDVSNLRSSIRRILPEERDIRIRSNLRLIILEGEVSTRYAMETAVDIARSFVGGEKASVHRIREDLDRPEKLTEKTQSFAPEGFTGVSGAGVSVGMAGGGGGATSGSTLEAGQQVPAPEQIPDVVNLLTVAETPQVLLEVKVAEVSRTLLKELGVNFRAFDRHGQTAVGTFVGGIVTPDTRTLPSRALRGRGQVTASDLITGSPEADFLTVQDDFSIAAFIDLLKENGLVRLLAEPNLIAMSGQEASFLAGGEFPIPIVQNFGGGGSTNGAISVEFKEFGVRLNFIPTVIGNNKVISLAVRPEVSQLDFANAVTLSGFRIPALNTRRASTAIELRSGETYAIAGLLDHRLRESVSKIPGFGDIPILGPLFRSSAFSKNETELLILVTPRLIKPLKPEEVPLLPTADYIEPTDYDFYLWGRLEGRPPGDDTALATVGPKKRGGLVGAWGHYH
jgi:pilus assembly protein CpaC